MEISNIYRILYVIDIWCDCGKLFRMEGENSDCICPECGAVYGVLPVRVDGA